MTSALPDEELSFEQAIDTIEDLVEKIESGEIGLEQAMTQYERGQSLIKHCRGILGKAEQRIAELIDGMDGQPTITEAEASAQDES